MNPLLRIAKSLVPSRVRPLLQATHRELVFRRAMERFMKDTGGGTRPEGRTLRDLIYGWGNESWSAQEEYLAHCIDHALTAPGPILECGSGLSTILVGAVANQRGLDHWALEHQPEWASRVERYLRLFRLDRVFLRAAPLKDHGEFCWYDAPLKSMPAGFALVICDGPPGGTRGGRYGLAPIMRERFRPGCVILLDDAGREEEMAIARRWQTELGVSVDVRGSVKPYLAMTVRGEENGLAR